ncbi:MAG: SxtJ family membrane protein [Planctomycetaceae bacterium]
MSLISLNTNPTQRQLRQFGVVSLIAMPAAGWLLFHSVSVTFSAAAVGALFAVLAFTAPNILKPAFVAISVLTIPFGLVLSELIMLTIFFGLFFPMALCFRVVRRDPLHRKQGSDKPSAWVQRVAMQHAGRYYRQY